MGQYNQLEEKYKSLQHKAQKLANKLRQTIDDKKKLKKLVSETKKKLAKGQKENENHKFLIEHLEIDSHQQKEIRKKNTFVLNQVMNENTYSQQECSQILKEIEDDEDSEYDLQQNKNQNMDESESENEDDDLTTNRLSGNKRRHSLNVDSDQKHDGSMLAEEDFETIEPPKKKMKNTKTSSVTPFKANKNIFNKPKKQKRSNKSVNLPKPRIK